MSIQNILRRVIGSAPATGQQTGATTQSPTSPTASRGASLALAGCSSTTLGFLLSAQETIATLSKKHHYIAFDATASRSGTWTAAIEGQIEQAKFLTEAGENALISVNYFSGASTFKGTPYTRDIDMLAAWMRKVSCVSGTTQIHRLFADVRKQITEGTMIDSVLYIGDHIDGDQKKALVAQAQVIGAAGTPVNILHEVDDVEWLDRNERAAAEAFVEMAEISGGTYKRFLAGDYATMNACATVLVARACGLQSPALERLKRDAAHLPSDARRLLLGLDRR